MPSRTPRIKFCGITALADAERAVALDAWAIGLIFWPHSPRRCTPEAAVEIGPAMKRKVEVAGVFVNATLEEIAATAEAASLTLVQLHGDEGPAFCSEVARRTGCEVIKAVRVSSRADIQALIPFHTDYQLLDSHRDGVPGGTGETFAWELARAHRGKPPLILSGGLNPDNVAGAIAAVHPFAVDVASGVELEPGRKDPDKLEAFAAAVAGAHAPPPGVAHARPHGSVHAPTRTS
jgi:phosphoribosylanthranilate isomerase